MKLYFVGQTGNGQPVMRTDLQVKSRVSADNEHYLSGDARFIKIRSICLC